jgi:hypothetical protein
METLKVPFKPSAITHAELPDGGSGRMIVLSKSWNRQTFFLAKELPIDVKTTK